MITQSPSDRARGPRIGAGRVAALLLAALVIGAAPFVARAFGDEPATDPMPGSDSQESVLRATPDDATSPTDRGREPVSQPAAQDVPPVQEQPAVQEELPV